MNMSRISCVISPIIIAITLLIFGCIPVYNLDPNNVEKQQVVEGRPSITFILGQDKSNNNNFYTNATYYYNMHPTQKTDFVINHCRTLKDILNYLERDSLKEKYGIINLVCHGNPWQGLSIHIDSTLPRASITNLKKSIDGNFISPICSKVIDSKTIINIVSCGVGQNSDYKKVLEKIFTCQNTGEKPNLFIEKYYVNFKDKLEMEKSNFYFVTSKYEFDEQDLIVKKLSSKYSDVAINWETAYENEANNNEKSPYRHHFKMVIEWEFAFKNASEIPIFRNSNSIEDWLKLQKNAMSEIKQMQLEPSDFQWYSLPSLKKNNVRVKGYCNVEGVMVDL